jgi:hypothetical protein
MCSQTTLVRRPARSRASSIAEGWSTRFGRSRTSLQWRTPVGQIQEEQETTFAGRMVCTNYLVINPATDLTSANAWIS